MLVSVAAGGGCVDSVPSCSEREYYLAGEGGGECVTWSPATWRESIRYILDSIEPVLPIIAQAAGDSLTFPEPDQIEVTQAILEDAAEGFPRIPFAIPLSDAPGHHTASLHAEEAVSVLRYGLDLLAGRERTGETASQEVKRGRYLLRRGIRHYHIARQEIEELPQIGGTLPSGRPSRLSRPTELSPDSAGPEAK